MAKRYQTGELIGEQGGVQTFAGRDAMNGLPVRVYSFVGEPALREGELKSDFIPPVLSSSYTGLGGEVVSAFSDEFGKLKGAVAPGLVEPLLKQTVAALDDAAKAGVVHGDLSPDRVFFDREGGAGGRFVLEGYGVPWQVRPSEFSAPERIGGASFAGDLFSWARTVKHLSGPLPGDLRDLLDRCLKADPSARPHARDMRLALERYPFGSAAPKPNRQAHRDVSAFERYAEDDRDDASLGELSELEPPSKTVKVQGYRQQLAERPVQPADQLPATDSRPNLPETSASAAKVRLMSASSTNRSSNPKEVLQQLDATEAYRVRLATYNAQQGAAPLPVSQTPATKPAAPAGSSPDTAVTVSEPRASEPSASAAPEHFPATTPPRPPRVRVQHIPEDPEEDKELAQTGREQGEGPTFEVFDDDDVNENAPDPTLYRGGRRVFLLTLLGIALLVLLALQLINA